jgi:hypothetical protein
MFLDATISSAPLFSDNIWSSEKFGGLETILEELLWIQESRPTIHATANGTSVSLLG